MHLFFHADRALALRPGMVLERRQMPDKPITITLAPFVNPEFAAHIEALAREGLSSHGIQYLYNYSGLNVSSYSLDLLYEYYRWQKFKDTTPSRFQCLFCTSTWEAAKAFTTNYGQGVIWEIECERAAPQVDMNLLHMSYDQADQENCAMKYWRGERMKPDSSYTPAWEYLVPLPVKVVQPVWVNPISNERVFM